MKVVIPVINLQISGGCRVLAQIANFLVKHNHEVEIAIPYGAQIHYPLTCKITRVPAIRKEYIPFGDIVLANYYKTLEACYHAWPKQCVRFTMGFEPYYVTDSKYALSLYQKKMPTITISQHLQKILLSEVGQSSYIASPGINLDVFQPKSLAKKSSAKTILYIARDPSILIKGYQDFLNSIEIVKKQARQRWKVHLICPENTPTPKHFPHKIFKPSTDEWMAHLYQKADLFVSTSWLEGFSLPPLEAMACGTAVVTTNSGGVLDYCKHNKTAIIVKKKNPYSIAKGILQVLQNPRLAQRLSRNGLHTAQNYSLDHFENKILQILQHIVETRKN